MRILSLLFASAIIALANPAPFGFELEKATYSELTAKYPVKQQGFNELSQGKAITVASNSTASKKSQVSAKKRLKNRA